MFNYPKYQSYEQTYDTGYSNKNFLNKLKEYANQQRYYDAVYGGNYVSNDNYGYCWNDTPQYDNHLTAKQREYSLKNNQNLYLHIDENPYQDTGWKWWCDFDRGKSAVNKYGNVVEEYANQYNINPDLVKAIMFTENACGHYYGFNDFMDYIGLSKSQMPMNIRGNIWSDFHGQHYNTFNPEQNIELGTRIIKQIYNSLDNPTPDRIGTLYNSAAKDKISSYGYRVGDAYKNKPWL
ncbi:MAG: hypothetical protein E7016_04705 [Alphaproteobacteria bacterium]|nr:hypothetical protein [Alphaproteobacteria bacterium]